MLQEDNQCASSITPQVNPLFEDEVKDVEDQLEVIKLQFKEAWNP